MSQAIASDKQFNFIASLISERQVTNRIPDVDAAVAALRNQRLTKKGASALIDTLLAQPKDPRPQDAQPEAPSFRENSYKGKCGRCGETVAPHEGYIEKHGRWVTYHHEGQCPNDLQAKLNAEAEGLPVGWYAIPFIGRDAARTDLTFLGLRHRQNGDVFMVHVVGGHGDRDDMSFEWSMKAIAALKAVDLEEATALYGRELKHCGRCGLELTNRESRLRGIGPECASKGF